MLHSSLVLKLHPESPLMYWGVQTGEKDSISTNNYLIITIIIIIIPLHLVDQEAITETS
jgi:hypothetical protein